MGHRSSGDWDFQDTNWELDTVEKVSEPSSLKLTRTAAGYSVILCKKNGTTALNQGRIVAWIRSNAIAATKMLGIFLFRNQAAVGSANANDTYQIQIWKTYARFDYLVGGATTVIASHNYLNGFTWTDDAWHKLRLTWWELEGTLWVRLERWTGTEWTLLCDDFSDANNRWSGETVNRVGHGKYVLYTGGYYVWYDDTEIWEPT